MALRPRAPLEKSILEECDKELPRVMEKDRFYLLRAICFKSNEAKSVFKVGSVFKTHLCFILFIVFTNYQLYIAFLVLIVMDTLFDARF